MSKILLLVSEFNKSITATLQEQAILTLQQEGNIAREDIDSIQVPGAFELSIAAAKASDQGHWDAILCLGALIEGDTPHFDYISQAVANGLTKVGVESKVPVVFGVLTTKTWEQAEVRSGLRPIEMDETSKNSKAVTNKGHECARAALKMIEVMKRLEKFEKK